MAVSLPGSAMRSRDSGQRILGGSRSAQREERDSWNLWMPWLSCEIKNHPRDLGATQTCCRASAECPSAGLVPVLQGLWHCREQQGQGSRGREVGLDVG